MNRSSFIRNTLLAICSTLLPEILRPMEGVVKEDEGKCVFYEVKIQARLEELEKEYGEIKHLPLTPEWEGYYAFYGEPLVCKTLSWSSNRIIYITE